MENYDYGSVWNDSSFNLSDLEALRNSIQLCLSNVGTDPRSNPVLYISNAFCIPFISICGILCNFLNALVLSRKGPRVPSAIYLLALAFCDCFFLIFGTLEVTPLSLPTLAMNPKFNRIYTHIVLYIRLLASTFYKASVLLVIAFNCERYICVCHPMKTRTYANKRVARWTILFSLIISFLLSLQWPISYGTESCYDLWTEDTWSMIMISPSLPLQYFYKAMDYINMILFNAVPIILLSLLNTVLMRTLRRVIRRDLSFYAGYTENSGDLPQPLIVPKLSLSSDRKVSLPPPTGRSANAILFAVVIMFLLCLGPQIPARILFEIYGPNSQTVQIYMAISQQLIFLNASMNFLLYCIVSRRYRRLLKKTLLKLCGMRKEFKNLHSQRRKDRKSEYVLKEFNNNNLP